MSKNALLIVLFVVAPLSIFAQTTVSGATGYDNVTYFKRADSSTINGRNQIVSEFKITHIFAPNVKTFSGLQFRYDQADRSRNRTYIDEAYIDLTKKDFLVRIGKQKYNWGKSDYINPTNYLGASDYSDAIDLKNNRIGVISADLKWYVTENTFFEGVYAPCFQPSELPGIRSRWWPEMPATADNPFVSITGKDQIPLDYSYSTHEKSYYSAENAQYALKVSSSVQNFDYSISYFNGYADMPDVETSIMADTLTYSSLNVINTFSYRRQNTFGADIAKNIGAVALRAEGALNVPSGCSIDSSSTTLKYVIGADRTLYVGDKSLFILLQWCQETTFASEKPKYSSYDMKHFIRKAILYRSQLSINDNLKIVTEGLYDFAQHHWLCSPGIIASLADGLELKAESNLLGGSHESYLGAFHNNRIHFSLIYSFPIL